MYPNCMTDIMILAQVVPQIFVHKVAFSHKTTKTEKGDNSVKYLEKILPNVNQVIYTLNKICLLNIMTLAQAVLHIFCSQSPLWVKCLSPKRGI